MENINFRNIPTRLELNGPTLSFTRHPVGYGACPGTSATFVGLATATFPVQDPANNAQNTGTISYRWYEEGVGALTDGGNISGAGTSTLTISNLVSPTDNGRKFYLTADYVPSTITGNALNEPISSDVALLTLYPSLTITSQPSDSTVAQSRNATFSVTAALTDNTTSNLAYQWSVNGTNVSDGNVNSIVQAPNATTTTTTASGYAGAGIYLDLTQYSGSTSVTISTSEESGIFHYINIPGVDNIPENAGSRTYNLQGGRVYGPCSAPNGGLYIGTETPIGGNNNLVVEEGGDDWNDMILSTNRGYFRRLTSAPTVTITSPNSARVTITDGSGQSSIVDLSSVSSYSSFVTGQVYTLRPETDLRIKAFLIGGGGGTSTNYRNVAGGAGGATQGEYRLRANTDYKILVGGGANNGSPGYGGGGTGNGGGGGGGYTGLFEGTVNQASAILIAGGGGGGGNDPAEGGAGGGAEGANGGNAPGRGGTGGTQLSGGSGYGPGSALQGGSGAGGGGGGYFGGAGGTPYSGCCADGAGGGGSGYIASAVTNGSYSATNSAGGGSPGQNGSFKIQLLETFTPVSTTNNISGSRTPTMTISTNVVGIQTVRCSIVHPTACGSPILSNVVNFSVINARQILNVEYATESGSGGAQLQTVNLFDTNWTLSGGSYSGYLTRFYAAETDLDVFIELYGNAGSNNGGFSGGEGGTSIIRTTLKRNVEYIITSLPQTSGTGAVFLYRKSRLIAVCAGGGSAGNGGNGGPGGGVNVGGGSGSGRGAGAGGALFSPGSLPPDGLFGSLSGALANLYPGDSVAPVPLGGRVIPCPKGYWYTRGYGACQDIGNQQLYRANGNVVTNSAFLDSGFKTGYGIRNTAGAGINGGGNGGAGATGGNGGNGGGGGGGGSGYSDGSVTIVSTTQGGHRGLSRVLIRSAI